MNKFSFVSRNGTAFWRNAGEGSSEGKGNPACPMLAISLAVAMLVGSLRVIVVTTEENVCYFYRDLLGPIAQTNGDNA